MEEDIKILEELISEFRYNQSTLDYDFKELYAEDIAEEHIQALEHLIKAYKKQEVYLNTANSIINKQIDILKNSVSKNKIKELKDFIISDCKQKNIDLIPVSNFIKNINIVLKGDE